MRATFAFYFWTPLTKAAADLAVATAFAAPERSEREAPADGIGRQTWVLEHLAAEAEVLPLGELEDKGQRFAAYVALVTQGDARAVRRHMMTLKLAGGPWSLAELPDPFRELLVEKTTQRDLDGKVLREGWVGSPVTLMGLDVATLDAQEYVLAKDEAGEAAYLADEIKPPQATQEALQALKERIMTEPEERTDEMTTPAPEEIAAAVETIAADEAPLSTAAAEVGVTADAEGEDGKQPPA